MYANWIRIGALAVVLGGASLLFGQDQLPPAETKTGGERPGMQPDKPKEAPKTKLEEMLQQAMRNNADIRVAEAKRATAEAELNRTRLVVMQKVILYTTNLADAKAKVEQAERTLKRIYNLEKNKAVSMEEVQTAEAALQSAKADMAKVEAELPLLIGTASVDKDRPIELWRWADLDLRRIETLEYDGVRRYERSYLDLKQPVQGPMAERIKKALDKEIAQSFTGNPLDVLTELLKQIEGVPSRITLTDKQVSATPIELDFHQKVPVGAVIQAFQDSASPQLRLVVRDYGILVTDQAHVPPGAALLYDVWKGDKAAKEKTGVDPKQNIEGVVKQVNATGMISISIGSDAGLKKGDTLAVLHTDPKTKALSYVAQVKVVAIDASHAVCERTDEAKGKGGPSIEVGDKVMNQGNID